jgi:hypothetical protein
MTMQNSLAAMQHVQNGQRYKLKLKIKIKK